MKNLLLIVFTITSFFTSTVFSQVSLTNPFTGEEVTLNENQEEKFMANEKFVLYAKNHIYWYEVYVVDPLTKQCFNKSILYTMVYYLILGALVPFCFNRIYRNNEGDIYKQRNFFITLLSFVTLLALLPFKFDVFHILFDFVMLIIASFVIISIALYITTLDNLQGNIKKVLIVGILAFVIAIVAYNTSSLGFYYFFKEFITPVGVWMIFLIIMRIVHTSLDIGDKKFFA